MGIGKSKIGQFYESSGKLHSVRHISFLVIALLSIAFDLVVQ